VNISSIFGIVAIPSQSAYNASKFAVKGFTEALRQELHGGPVHVTCVHPGGVRTNIVRNGRGLKNSRGEATTTEALAKDFDRIAQVTPEAAAHTIWTGVLRNSPRILVGLDAKFLDLLQRLLPTGYTTLVRMGQKRLARRGLNL
jgi:short-subunit dehydrogenase